jgi:hypothetical protein
VVTPIQRPRLLSAPTSVVAVPFDVRFFTGVRLSQMAGTSSSSPTYLRIPYGLLRALQLQPPASKCGATNSGDELFLAHTVNKFLVGQVCEAVAHVLGGAGQLRRELHKGAFQWVCLINGTASVVHALVDAVARGVDRVDITAVFRGRGGKGKAAFLARLERKGQEYRRAVQMAAHNARQTGQAMTGAAATATRRTQAASLLTARVGHHNRREGGAASRTRRSAAAAQGEGQSDHQLAIESEADKDPNHPLSVLRRKQERERVEIERLRGVAKSAVARGMMKMNQLQTSSS